MVVQGIPQFDVMPNSTQQRYLGVDIEFIRRWAEETGDPAAMEIMGYLYARGIGVPRDPEFAYIWYGRAFLAGETGVKVNMDILWREMASRNEAALERVTRYFDDYQPAAGAP